MNEREADEADEFCERIEDEVDAWVEKQIEKACDEAERHVAKRMRKRVPAFPEKGGYQKWGRDRWTHSEWQKLLGHLRDEALRQSNPEQYKKHAFTFRKRFRVPFEIFTKLLDKAEASKVFAPKQKGHSDVPLEMKLLSTLRYNAVGCAWDVIEEISHVSISTSATFHAKYMKWFRETQYDEYVNPTDITKAEGQYSMLGFPGCVGSMDGVHLAWDNSPNRLAYTGKEAYPTVAFNVVCDSNGRCQSMTHGFPGKVNDKTQVRVDPFIHKLRGGDEKYYNFKFRVRGDPKDKKKWMDLKGAYVLCDGGYHQWRELICGVKNSVQVPVANFAARAESVRKDVECLFGRTKKRFRVLRVPFLFKSQAHIENTFRFCMALHNMLLEYDGIADIGQDEADWIDADVADHLRRVQEKVKQGNAGVDDATRTGYGATRTGYGNVDNHEQCEGFTDLRNALTAHISHLGKNLKWRKKASDIGLLFKQQSGYVV